MAELIPQKTMSQIIHFFRLLTQRNFAEAERDLERIRAEIKQTSWHKGYYNALEGMLISLKSTDSRYLYINRINTSNQKKADELEKLFSRSAKNQLMGDFDKGFFAAWAEYMQVLQSEKMEKSEKPERLEKPRTKSLNEFI